MRRSGCSSNGGWIGEGMWSHLELLAFERSRLWTLFREVHAPIAGTTAAITPLDNAVGCRVCGWTHGRGAGGNSGRGARSSEEVEGGVATRCRRLRGNPGTEGRFELTSVKVSQEPQEGRHLRFATVGNAEPFVIETL